jgi:transcriptional regulator with XRE-family HTH domain
MTLRWMRLVRGFTQHKLRQLTGIHQSRLSLFKTGQAIPTPEEKQKLEKALNGSGHVNYRLRLSPTKTQLRAFQKLLITDRSLIHAFMSIL